MVDAIALRWFYVALSVPFVFSSNDDGFLFHDRTSASAERVSRRLPERVMSMGNVFRAGDATEVVAKPL